MGITVSQQTGNKTVYIPATELPQIDAGPPEVRQLDINWLRLQCKAYEASEEGMAFDDLHTHDTQVTMGGITYARFVEFNSDYRFIIQDAGLSGDWYCLIVGAQNNLQDVLGSPAGSDKMISIGTNSPGLINVTEVTDILAEAVAVRVQATIAANNTQPAT